MELELVTIENPNELNLILGQSHFIKTVEDLHETLVQAVPGIKFGIAFCEASGEALIRLSGNDPAPMPSRVTDRFPAEYVMAGRM